MIIMEKFYFFSNIWFKLHPNEDENFKVFSIKDVHNQKYISKEIKNEEKEQINEIIENNQEIRTF